MTPTAADYDRGISHCDALLATARDADRQQGEFISPANRRVVLQLRGRQSSGTGIRLFGRSGPIGEIYCVTRNGSTTAAFKIPSFIKAVEDHKRKLLEARKADGLS